MNRIAVIVRRIGVLALYLMLTACFGLSRPSPADIKPTYQVKNSPLPVPSPRWNPRRPPYAGGFVKPGSQDAAKASVSNKPVQQAEAARPSSVSSNQSPARSLQTVSVRRGETLYALSRRHGVPVRALIAENNLRAPYSLAIGQKLRIPVTLKHTVERGDTGYSISRRYGVNLASLMQVNGIKKPYRLSVGQVLELPGGAEPAVNRSPATQVAEAPRGRVVPLPEPPARSRSGFTWPVTGKLASRYGPKEGGLHNDGINILAPQGAAVRSAEAGVVVYASNALEGYGNLLLLKHADGWLTAYAHNERLLVNKGDQITKGQVIARVGSTGGVQEPQLHFEIRKGRRALDPLDYLDSQVASSR